MATRRKTTGKGSSGGGRKREPAPFEQLALLERGLAEGAAPARAYVLRGEERYFKERAIDAIVAKAASCGLEICRHDAVGWPTRAVEFDLARLLDDLAGQPLFGSARLVLVRHADPLLKKTEGSDSPLTRAVKAFLARPHAEGTVVLEGSSLRADHAAVKACVAAGGELLGSRKLWDTPPPWSPGSPSELGQWFLGRARERGLRLSAEEGLYVVTVTGNDLFALDAEIQKLQTTGARDLRAKIPWTADVSPFAVGDAMIAGDVRKAAAGLEGLFRAGFKDRDGKREVDASALGAILLSHLSRKLRQILIAAEARAAGADLSGAAERAGVARAPRALQDLEARLASGGRERYGAMLGDVAALERASRRGVRVDVNDLARLALRWRRRARPGAAGAAVR